MGAKSQKRHVNSREDTPSGFSCVAEIGVHQGSISGIAVSPDGNRVMVTNYGKDSISFIEYRANGPVVRTVVGTDEPFAVAAVGRRAYVSTVWPAYDAIMVLDVDTNLVVDVHPMAQSVRDLAVSPDGNQVVAARTTADGADVAVLDTTNGRIDAIAIADSPGATAECVRLSPNGRRAYLATNTASGGNLAVIDLDYQRVVSSVEIESPVRDVAISPDGGAAYVVSSGPDFGAVLDVIDTRSNAVLSTHKIAEISGLVAQLALSRDGERAYLVSDDGVSVLRTQTHELIGTIAVDGQPSCVIESPDGTHLYIAGYNGTVSMVETASADTAPIVWGDEEPTAAHEWFMPELLQLEPAMS